MFGLSTICNANFYWASKRRLSSQTLPSKNQIVSFFHFRHQLKHFYFLFNYQTKRVRRYLQLTDYINNLLTYLLPPCSHSPDIKTNPQTSRHTPLRCGCS